MCASSFNSKARGTAILINKNLPFVKTVTDPMGRYIMIHGNMNSESWTLLNIYAPTMMTMLFSKRFSLRWE